MSEPVTKYKPGQGYYGELPKPDPHILEWAWRDWEPEAPHLLMRLSPKPSDTKRGGDNATR